MTSKKDMYIESADTTKDVQKQDIDNKSREITLNKLQEAYIKALDLVDVDPLPEQITNSAKLLEEELYKEYHKQPKEYIKQLAKLIIFLDPTHYIGQFAKMFRIKTLQNVYTPDRLIRLDITDMLPEVFLNPKTTQAVKLDIYQNINQLMNEQTTELYNHYNSILNPTAHIPTQSKSDIEKDFISNHHTDIKDLCDNPYWKMKRVNTIIHKESGKFYCLNVEQLLLELAKSNTATNYFTKKELPQEIINNLCSRYATEIEEIKQNGDAIEVGSYTKKEVDDLEQTLHRLEEFKTVFNQKSVLSGVELFGIGSVEDPNIKGVKNILDNIPTMVKEEFEGLLSTKTFTEAVEQINLWLDSSVDEIKIIIKSIQDETDIEQLLGEEPVPDIEQLLSEEPVPDIEQLLSEEPVPDIEQLPSEEPAASSDEPVKGDEQEDLDIEDLLNKYADDMSQPVVNETVAQMESEEVSQTPDTITEERLVMSEILRPNTVSSTVYNNYIERLKIANKTITEVLKTTQDMSARSKLHDHSLEVDSQLKEVRTKGRTIKGVISLLESSLHANNEKLAQITEATGMNLLYPQQLMSGQQEKADIEQFVGQLHNEIAYLEELHTNFVNIKE